MSEGSNKSTAREFKAPWWVGLYKLPKNRKESLESAYSSNSRLNLLTKRKRMNTHAEMSSRAGDKFVSQRVLSAKVHRVKQLQNQLNDAHIHLQELSNENRMLRAMQRKQEAALARYENTSAELPTMLNSHEEEIRIQQTRYKQLKQQHKEVTQKLKEREMQLQQLRDEHQHLLELSKDRNLLEREKLQNQVAELTAKVQQQSETISTLQRRIALEAKNFKHQLQNEINKHKDTRHDLDLAISNADKLSSIIEMKEKMLSTVASRNMKSPTRSSEPRAVAPSKSNIRATKTNEREKITYEERMDQRAKMIESRDALTLLSHDEDTTTTTSVEPPRSRYTRSRLGSSSSRGTINTSRKSSKGSEEFCEMAKTVQDGMSDLAIFDDNLELANLTPEDYKNRIDDMKKDLLRKIKNETETKKSTVETPSRRASGLRRGSTEESIEEEIEEDGAPKLRGRRNSTVSFTTETNADESALVLYDHKNGQGDEIDNPRTKREGSSLEMRRRPVEKYCTTLLQDIEKSTKIIDKHVKQFNHTKIESDKLVQQLQNVDKLNEFVNFDGDIPPEALAELNNNFKLLTDSPTEAQMGRKRSIAARRGSSRAESRTSLLGDTNMSNQDLLNDLLGRK